MPFKKNNPYGRAYKRRNAFPIARPELSHEASIRGSTTRHIMPIGSILSRVAQKVIHERVVIKKKKKCGEEVNGSTKLTNAQVREIRAKYKPYVYTSKMLAEEYGVHQRTITSIISGDVRPFA